MAWFLEQRIREQLTLTSPNFRTSVVSLGHIVFNMPDKFMVIVKNAVSRKVGRYASCHLTLLSYVSALSSDLLYLATLTLLRRYIHCFPIGIRLYYWYYQVLFAFKGLIVLLVRLQRVKTLICLYYQFAAVCVYIFGSCSCYALLTCL